MSERFVERNLLPSQKDKPFPVFSSVPPTPDAPVRKPQRVSLQKLQRHIFRDSYPYVKEDELKDFLTGVGLDAGQTMSAWEASYWKLTENQRVERKKLADLQIKNFATICRMESAEPGSAKTLHDEFDIKIFGRYPVPMLLEQYKEKDSVKRPYGLLVFAKGDHNGVFYENNLHHLKHPSYTLRITEVGGKADYENKIVSMDDRYGGEGGRKISFQVNFAHGFPNHIQFGAQARGAMLTKNHFRDEEMVWKLRKCYEEDAIKILASCYTGVKNGIASYMAEQLGMTVVGPDDAAACPIIRPRRWRNEKFDFFVNYPPADISKGLPREKRYGPSGQIFLRKAS